VFTENQLIDLYLLCSQEESWICEIMFTKAPFQVHVNFKEGWYSLSERTGLTTGDYYDLQVVENKEDWKEAIKRICVYLNPGDQNG
jgi:hypothetical protein